jgi:histidine triad (HIT) family protein
MVEDQKQEDCIFCKITNGEIPSEKIYDDDNFFAIKDINPVSEGHALIITKKHFSTLLDMPNSLGNELIEAAKKVALNLIKECKAEGFNLVQSNYEVAQQEIPHVHFHIVPRKKDDGLRYRFKD